MLGVPPPNAAEVEYLLPTAAEAEYLPPPAAEGAWLPNTAEVEYLPPPVERGAWLAFPVAVVWLPSHGLRLTSKFLGLLPVFCWRGIGDTSLSSVQGRRPRTLSGEREGGSLPSPLVAELLTRCGVGVSLGSPRGLVGVGVSLAVASLVESSAKRLLLTALLTILLLVLLTVALTMLLAVLLLMRLLLRNRCRVISPLGSSSA